MTRGNDTSGSAGHDATLAATPSPASASDRRAEGPASAYAAHDLVAERYRIVRPLGAGGMGEVYEAEDLLLHERVALKTLREPVAGDETTILRFKREIQLARRVTHPNVCRIFDVGLDKRGGRENAFLTMELLDGETLSARLKRQGKLAPEEARAITEQVAAALQAAHSAGVIHRDLKSANVMVMGEGTRVRAVVTDFGLARTAEGGGDQVTGDGGVVGSPAYMAPEQVEGSRNLTGAVDVYALGVVMFEMVTGRLPFIGDTPLASAVMRLREDAPSPRSIAPEVAPLWDQAILACLSRKPEDRPGSALEVTQRLRGEIAPSAPSAKVGKKRWLGKAVIGAVVVCASLALIAKLSERGSRRPERDQDELPGPPGNFVVPPVPPPPPPIAPSLAQAGQQRRAVAIMPLRNLVGRKEIDYVSTAIAEMLATELATGNELRAVAGESVARARQSLGLTETETYAPDTLRRLRRLLDADLVVTGSYTLSGDDGVRVDVRLQDTRNGETVASVSESGELDELSAIVESLGEKLREGLHVEQPTEDERQGARALLPRDTDVTRLYSEGLALMRVDHCSAARGPLEQAVATDPEFALAHQALSQVLDCLGYDTRALDEARKALDLSENLPPEVRLQAEANLHQLTGQTAEARQAYEKLFAAAPDNYDFGLALLRFQRKDDPKAAKKTLVILRKLAKPTGESPELDYSEALLAEGDSAKLAGLEHARAVADEQGARLLAASARLNASNIQLRMGRLDDALDEAGRAKEIFEASGDRDGVIQALQVEAVVHQKRKDPEGARRALREATELGKHLDSVRSLVELEDSLGRTLMDQGDLDGGEAALLDVIKLNERAGKQAPAAFAYLGLARLRFYRGDVRGALHEIEKAAALAEESNADEVKTITRYVLAFVTLKSGAVDEARQILDQAMKDNPQLKLLGVDRYFEAEAAIVEKDYPRAEKAARELAGMSSEKQRRFTDRLGSDGVLLEALVRQGKTAEALRLVEQVRARLGSEDAFAERLALDTLAARARGASKKRGDREAAIASLEETSQRAEKAGFLLAAMEADLHRGELQLETDRRAGQTTLAQVLRDAKRKGVTWIASEAAEAL